MNLIDSSGWLEFFAGGENADFFAPAIEDTEHVIVPVICLYEVYKVMLRERNRTVALQAISAMQEGTIVDINQEAAIEAAAFSHREKIPMADSLICAVARQYDAIIWTQDADFKDLPNVEYVGK